MKKFLVISLACIYLAISSGVVVNLHYCMGKLAEIALAKSQSGKCGKCGMENTGCCHDDTKIVKLQDSHQLNSIQVDIAKAEAIAPAQVPNFDCSLMDECSHSQLKNHSPPDITDKLSLTLLNCVFRI